MSRITEREKEILKLLKNDPMISQEELAGLMGITRSAAAVHISNLIKKGFILGRGYVFNDKTGVLVIGRVLVEIEAGGEEKESGSSFIDIEPGGTGYLIASHLASQEIPTLLMSVIGRDEWGGIIGEKLKKSGVDVRYLMIQNKFPTPRRVILTTGQSSRENMITDARAMEAISGNSLHTLGITIDNCRMVILDSDIPPGVFTQILRMAGDAGIPLCIRLSEEQTDLVHRDDLPGVFMTVMPAPAAEAVSGLRIRHIEDAMEAAREINRLGVEISAVVLADQGVALAYNKGTVSVPIMPVQDKTGKFSLDIFTAGLVSGILQGYDHRQAVRFGMGIAVCRVRK
ncbi:MAG: hypothetical protein CVU89_07145 [Firmicutes bacterium HGW-Firmicutes-14]|nr:MAG: hypothetical protein CVU89_07145 [Firmicutes bacterium HGW-Firmicutes-14]